MCFTLFQTEEVPSVPTRVVAVEYPLLAVQARIQGTVKLEISFDQGGGVTDVRILEDVETASKTLLAAAAKTNVSTWKFSTSPKQTTARRAMVTYVFRLEGVTSGKRNESFVFDYPGTATLVSEAMCPDHSPCPEDRLKQRRPDRKELPKPPLEPTAEKRGG